MQPTQGDKLQITLFEGVAGEVMVTANGWLKREGRMVEVVDIGFNYQGPEYDGKKKLTDCGTHGVLIVYRNLTINEVRAREGHVPIPKCRTDEMRRMEAEEHRAVQTWPQYGEKS